MSPCSHCRRSKRRCVASSFLASRCAECMRMGRSNCDYTTKLTSVNDWASLDRQRQKLRDERNATMAKLLRLSKQERFIDEREKAMIERGLASLDELDKGRKCRTGRAGSSRGRCLCPRRGNYLPERSSHRPRVLRRPS